jgi:predicted ATPase/DNA-binding CsgD family transcriptional regulator
MQHNLPRDVSSFVGRDSERAEVANLIGSTRLLTLVGPGGVGKTRLAIQVASEALAHYPDGVWVIELGPLASGELVPMTIAQVLGVREQPGIPLINTLHGTVGRTRQLLVLDNCEHLIDACAHLAHGLLRTCPNVHVMATSREPLGITGEVVWQVPPLGLPVGEGDEDDADALRLFVERAKASLPSFEVLPASRAAVIQICRQLDGLPLAIELAASRVRMLAPDEIAGRLADRFKLLTGGSRSAPARQQTLEAAINWSYELLSAPERRLFEDLSVFVDGFSVAGLAAVSSSSGESEVLDLLGRLVDRSLVVVERTPAGGETRYRLLETVRAFAWQRLIDRGDADLVRQRLANWLIGMAERADAAFHGPDQGRWLRWAESEHGNIRVALDWLIERQDTHSVLRLVIGPWWSWIQRGRHHESIAAFEATLALPGASTHRREWGKLLVAAGMFGIITGSGDQATGRARLEEALAIGLEVGDPWIYLNARAALNGIVYLREGQDLDRAHAMAVEMLDEARRVGQTWIENRALVSIATIALKRGDFDSAQVALEGAAEVARQAEDRWSLAMTLVPMGDVARSRGQHAEAGRLYQQSLAQFVEIGLADHPLEHPYLLHNLGYVALAADQPAGAGQRFREAIAGYRRVGDSRGVAECLIGLGATASAQGRAEIAVKLFAAGEAALAARGAELWHSNQADYLRWRGVAMQMIESDAFDVAWAAGAELSVDDAIALAEAGRELVTQSQHGRRRAGPAAATGALTTRELEVARLMAAGLTNRQISEALVIAEKTAANHVQRVLDKLGLHSRSELAARSAALGLQTPDSLPI